MGTGQTRAVGIVWGDIPVMKLYRARLQRRYPCGNLKLLQYYFKASSLVKARRRVRRHYAPWRLTSIKAVDMAWSLC